jgi:lambda repressor-like predicted transcriptional regulator
MSDDIMCSLQKVGHLSLQALRTAANASYDGFSVSMTRSWQIMNAFLAKEAVQHLYLSPQHTATSQMSFTSTLALVAKFLRKTLALETYVNHVKLTVFSIKDSAPILAKDRPVYTAMATCSIGSWTTQTNGPTASTP